jgi:hypothetical protein
MILKYSTNDFRGIIRFSAVCQQWKNVGDYTFLWLNCPLYFYSSRLYFETEVSYGNNLIQAGDRYFTKIRLDDPLPLMIPSNKFKIEVSRYRGSTGCLSQDSRIYGLKPFEEAHRFRTDFMRIFVEYHQLWNWYGRWRPFLDRFKDLVTFILDSYARFSLIAGIALTSLSVYLLSDLPKYNEGELSLANHFGFGCLYLVAFLYIIFFPLEALHSLYFQVRFPRKYNLNSPMQLRQISLALGVTSILWGLVISLALFHIKLSSGDNNLSFLFSFIPLPLWFFCLLAFGLPMFHSSDFFQIKPIERFLVVTGIIALFSIPLTFSLLALYYDSPTTHFGMTSAWLAIIPLIPNEISVFLLVLYSLWGSIILWKDWWMGTKPIVSQYDRGCCCMPPRIVRLLVNFFRTASAVFMMLLVIYFNIGLTGKNPVPKMNLADGVVAWVLFVLVFQFSSYCRMYDMDI